VLRCARLAAVWAVAVPLACVAQQPVPVQPSVLMRGDLTVWMARRGTAAERAHSATNKVAATLGPPKNIVEKTPSELGQAASDVGQTASSYGTASSNVGQNASDTGQTAGSYGQTAGGFGQASSDVGQTAGSYGTTAGNFGESLSDASAPPPQMKGEVRDPLRDRIAADMRSAYPALQMHFREVLEVDVADLLAQTRGSAAYPDVIVDAEMPGNLLPDGVGLMMLGLPVEERDASLDHGLYMQAQDAVILTRAPHPAQARAFVTWLRDAPTCGYICPVVQLKGSTEQTGNLAVEAVARILGGGTLGAIADADAAQFSGGAAQMLALAGMRPRGNMRGQQLQIDVLSLAQNEHIAMAAVRGIVTSPDSFGAVHAQVVLRKDDKGVWKVLQVQPNMWPGQLGQAMQTMRRYVMGPQSKDKALGISQAAPPDGDNRPAQPDLWWDNKGGAALQVVEWQWHTALGWSSTGTLMVPDDNPHLTTRVTAVFATQQGQYQWRVWSVASDGTMDLSPWRKLNIVGK